MDAPQDDPLAIARATVRRARSLVALPEAAARAGQVAEDPDSTLQELGQAFSQDPALCSHLLKVANSALYGLRCEVSSIEHAAALLGRKVLRNVALAASLQAVLPKADVHRSFSVAALWRHSIRTAAAACVLAREADAWEPEEAFAAGLIHDLGLLVEIESDREVLSEVFEEVLRLPREEQGAAMRSIETTRFGADHQHFGSAMCEAWGFPEALRDVAAHHHDPQALPEASRKLACVVSLARAISAHCEHGLTLEAGEVLPAPGDLASLGLAGADFEALIEPMQTAAEEIEAAF